VASSEPDQHKVTTTWGKGEWGGIPFRLSFSAPAVFTHLLSSRWRRFAELKERLQQDLNTTLV